MLFARGTGSAGMGAAHSNANRRASDQLVADFPTAGRPEGRRCSPPRSI